MPKLPEKHSTFCLINATIPKESGTKCMPECAIWNRFRCRWFYATLLWKLSICWNPKYCKKQSMSVCTKYQRYFIAPNWRHNCGERECGRFAVRYVRRMSHQSRTCHRSHVVHHGLGLLLPPWSNTWSKTGERSKELYPKLREGRTRFAWVALFNGVPPLSCLKWLIRSGITLDSLNHSVPSTNYWNSIIEWRWPINRIMTQTKGPINKNSICFLNIF